jgi:FkbM family methyltransferase
MSTIVRQCTLRLLKSIGVKKFLSTSGLGLPFIVHLGDSFGEMPYYNRETHRAEIILMAAWCQQAENPLILDIGGHVGFVATQVAQLLEDKHPLIYSFEPVPHTFVRLLETVRLLNLQHSTFPICCALSNKAGVVQISYSEWNSMFAQIFAQEPNPRAGDKVASSNALTLDQVVNSIGTTPDLIKVDVEGHETQVFEGGLGVFSQQEPPAICFELNPLTLSEAGLNAAALQKTICKYDLYYINDFEQRRIELGSPIADLTKINWVCNIFGVPSNDYSTRRWIAALQETRWRLESLSNVDSDEH